MSKLLQKSDQVLFINYSRLMWDINTLIVEEDHIIITVTDRPAETTVSSILAYFQRSLSSFKI